MSLITYALRLMELSVHARSCGPRQSERCQHSDPTDVALLLWNDQSKRTLGFVERLAVASIGNQYNLVLSCWIQFNKGKSRAVVVACFCHDDLIYQMATQLFS